MTPKQETVLKTIQGHPEGIGPTAIGLACGKSYAVASAWANGALKPLLRMGAITRSNPSAGVVLYAPAQDPA